MTDPIHQEVTLPASPERVYRALTDAAAFGALTGAPAEIDATPGGAFTCFGGAISGRQIELVPGRRVVQAWRVGSWDEGVFFVVRFALEPAGGDTSLVFDHVGFPPEERDHLAAGWPQQYWEPLAAYLRGSA